MAFFRACLFLAIFTGLASATPISADKPCQHWTTLAKLPRLHQEHSTVSVDDNTIAVIGGVTPIGNASLFTGFTTVDWLHLMTSLPTAGALGLRSLTISQYSWGRQHAAGAIVDETLCITGGRWFEKTNVRDDVFILDLNNLTAGWKTVKTHMPTARGGIAGAAVGAKLYAFGGETSQHAATGVFNNVEVFDVETQKWEELAPMQVPRHGTSAATDGLMMMVNGVGHFLNTTDHFDVLTV
ncbi:hypothetical protein NCS52_00964100 [Fusarium sp. LHS14.1]|nr:hypothetical protein NCS52_00964100 [Fusarium sp. LHS14.1]